MRTIKLGFIGAGAVGQMHIRHWSGIPGCEIVAVADLRPRLKNLVAEKYGIPLQYDSHKDLLKNSEIEAVAVVVRRNNTAAVVYDCLSAGKHVFSEKPMAKTLDQAVKLADAAESNGLVYSIGYQRRHDAGTLIGRKKLEELLTTRELGKVSMVRSWNFTGQDRIQGQEIMTDEDRPPGVFWEQTPSWLPDSMQHAYDRFINVYSHDVNMIRSLFGRTPRIEYINLENSQGLAGVFDFGDFLCVLEGGLNELNTWQERGEWDEGVEIFFERGRLIIKFAPPLIHDQCSRVELIKGKEKTVLCSGTGNTPAFQLEAEDFVSAVRNNSEPMTSGRQAVEDSSFIESLWRHYLSRKGAPAGIA